jgi:hypothetical protein
MNTPAAHPAETALQKEQRLFNELFSRLGNALLNRLFDLRPERAVRRMRYLTILFLVISFLVTLQYYPLILWAQHVQDIFSYLFSQNYIPNFDGDPFSNIGLFVFQAYTDPRALQYLPVFLAPFFIALQSAAIYLADVFELEDVSVARSFIWEVALSGGGKTIRVSHGEISEEHQETPTFLIGGPGRVIVDLDSVALFEKSDGTPHVIGPTGKEPGGKAILEGFERFRQAIDIRDHYVDLRDQDPRSESVVSRSRDGIPITATDVRLMFSVYRGEGPRPPVEETPYPFDKKAIEQIVYKATSKVTPGQINPSAHEFEWTNNMIGLIRSELSGFMNKHNLSVYLASTGMPELEKIRQREEAIDEQIRNLAQSDEEKPKAKDDKKPPEFQPRYKITNLFMQFTQEFTSKSHNKGVELHWIGVGTWKSPIELIPEKHLEAWKISQENMNNDSPSVMKGTEDKARIEKMVVLINAVPLAAYHDLTSGYKYSKKSSKKQDTKPRQHQKEKREDEFDDDDILFDDDEITSSTEDMVTRIKILRILQAQREQREAEYYRDPDQKEVIQSLLLEYRKQFKETIDFIREKKEIVPQNMIEAITYIDGQLNFKHWVGNHNQTIDE